MTHKVKGECHVNMRFRKLTVVFWVALTICTLFVIYGAIAPKQLESVTQAITNFIAVNFG